MQGCPHDFFYPNHKASSMEYENTSDNIEKKYVTVQLEGDLIPTRKKMIFKFIRIMANNKKTLNVEFFAQP